MCLILATGPNQQVSTCFQTQLLYWMGKFTQSIYWCGPIKLARGENLLKLESIERILCQQYCRLL